MNLSLGANQDNFSDAIGGVLRAFVPFKPTVAAAFNRLAGSWQDEKRPAWLGVWAVLLKIFVKTFPD